MKTYTKLKEIITELNIEKLKIELLNSIYNNKSDATIFIDANILNIKHKKYRDLILKDISTDILDRLDRWQPVVNYTREIKDNGISLTVYFDSYEIDILNQIINGIEYENFTSIEITKEKYKDGFLNHANLELLKMAISDLTDINIYQYDDLVVNGKIDGVIEVTKSRLLIGYNDDALILKDKGNKILIYNTDEKVKNIDEIITKWYKILKY